MTSAVWYHVAVTPSTPVLCTSCLSIMKHSVRNTKMQSECIQIGSWSLTSNTSSCYAHFPHSYNFTRQLPPYSRSWDLCLGLPPTWQERPCSGSQLVNSTGLQSEVAHSQGLQSGHPTCQAFHTFPLEDTVAVIPTRQAFGCSPEHVKLKQ